MDSQSPLGPPSTHLIATSTDDRALEDYTLEEARAQLREIDRLLNKMKPSLLFLHIAGEQEKLNEGIFLALQGEFLRQVLLKRIDELEAEEKSKN